MDQVIDNDATLSDEAIVALLKRAYQFAKPEQAEAASRLTLDSTVESLGIDSLAALEMSGFVEEELDLHFQDDELVAIRSMRDLASLMRKHAARRH